MIRRLLDHPERLVNETLASRSCGKSTRPPWLFRPTGACTLLAVLLLVVLPCPAQDPPSEGAERSEEAAPAVTERRRPTHAELYAAASERPLTVPETRTPEGEPLNESELAALRKADELMNSAAALRRSGEYADAKQKITQALASYRKLVGPSHHKFVTAVAAASSVDLLLKAPPNEREQLVEADKQENLAAQAMKAGQFAEARAAARSAIEIREKLLGREHPELIEPLRLLGYALTELRSLDEAERVLIRSLEICENVFGKSHPRTALVLDRVGWLRFYQSKPDEAAGALRRSLFILQSTVGETTDTAEVMDNLGTALVAGGIGADIIEAGNHKLRALFIRERLLGPDARETGISLGNLAWVYSRAGLIDEVIPLRKRALEIFVATIGPEHRDTLVEQSNLAQSYRNMGQLEEAMALYQSMVEMDASRGGPPDQGVVGRLILLGMLQLETDKQAEGEKTLREAFRKAVQLHEAGEHGAALNELNQLALGYQSRRMLDDALEVRAKLKQLEDSRPGRANELSIRRNVQLGRLYVEVGRAAEGIELLQSIVNDARAFFGDGEKEMMGPLLGLAHAQLEAGELDAASRTCSEVMRLTEQKYSGDAISTAYALHAMGRVQVAQKSYDVARFTLEEARDALGDGPSSDPFKYVTILQDISVCHLKTGEPQQAVKIMRDALEICNELKSPFPMQHKTLRAGTLKHLIDALEKDSSADPAEREKLIGELKQTLQELRDARAVTAELKEWMKELGLSAARG